MTLLAIDTSGPSCAVCLADPAMTEGAAVLSRREERIGRGHAERLVPMIEEALADAGLGFDNLERIAVAVGPGSFTGVRVGVAAARGLALALGIEAVGVGSLEALAAGGGRAAAAPVVIAVLAGPRGDVFALAEEAGGGVRLEPTLIAPAELARMVVAWRGEPVALIGSGARPLAILLSGQVEVGIVREAEAPDVSSIARLVLAGRGKSPPRPLYLRPPDARPQTGQAIARA